MKTTTIAITEDMREILEILKRDFIIENETNVSYNYFIKKALKLYVENEQK